MIRFRYLLSAAGFALCATAASAQYPQSAYPQLAYQPFAVAPLSDADQLAQQLRTVAADPTNLYALLNAARLSLKVGDVDAAAQLYTRAEKLAPSHPQVKAGMARLLVQAERPGEALRLFAEAQALGATPADFGSDRALAYDLIGEQARAQREYRAVLGIGADDETTRRYALSLGISGRKEPALALLEPLNRRSDRGAWRARAFVLAMNDGRAEADRIATTMMPPGMADGLRPFFDRLPRLGATDRAFAVHFGSVRASPARLADARLVPPLPALSPEPDPFAAPARAGTIQVAAADAGRSRRLSRRERRAAAQLATRTAAAPYVAPLPAPPAPTATQLAALGSTRLAPPLSAYVGARATRSGVTVLPPPAEAYRPRATQMAAATPSVAEVEDGPDEEVAPAPTATLRQTSPQVSPAAQALVAVAGAAGTGIPVPPATTPMAGVLPATATQPSGSAETITVPPATPVAVGTEASTATTPALTTIAPATVPAAAVPTQVAAVAPAIGDFSLTPPFSAAPQGSIPIVPAAPPAVAPPLPGPPPATATRGDSVLAAIVAGISVPESELKPEVTPPPLGRSRLLANLDKAEAASADARARLPKKDARGRYIDAAGKPLIDARGRPLDAKAAAAWQVAEAAKADAKAATALPKKDARGRFVDSKGKPLLDARGRPLDAKAAALWQAGQGAAARVGAKDDPKLKKDARGRFVDAAGKPLLDARGRPLDGRAAAAKLASAKPDPKKPEPSVRAEPQRYWVQVAGGANEATLAKEFARVAAATPSLRGKSGWTTPLRATNRVLTGPYKTSAEAMAMVNQLKKEGLAAFMFTSDPGQKVTRLGAR